MIFESVFSFKLSFCDQRWPFRVRTSTLFEQSGTLMTLPANPQGVEPRATGIAAEAMMFFKGWLGQLLQPTGADVAPFIALGRLFFGS